MYDGGSLVSHFFHSKVTRFGEDLQVLTSFASLTFTLVLCFVKRDKLRKLIHVLNRVDRKLIGLGAIMNYKLLSRVVIVALVIQIGIFAFFVASTVVLTRSITESPSIFEWMFFFMPVAVISSLQVQFYCMMRIFAFHLHYINFILHKQEMQASSVKRKDVEKHISIFCAYEMKLNSAIAIKRDKYDVIVELCRTHEIVCDAANLAEEYFSHQMLTLVTIGFIYALFNVYSIIGVVYLDTVGDDSGHIDKVAFIAFFILYTVISVGSVYVLLRSATMVADEVKYSP